MKTVQKNVSHKNQSGFTLIEFMIASVLGLIVIAAVGGLYAYNRKLNDIAQTRVGVQQELRTAGQMITRDARMAGSFGCVSWGRKYAPDRPYGSPEFKISGTRPTASEIAAPFVINEKGKGSFGVKVIEASVLKDDVLNTQNEGFTPTSDALIFYYGSGAVSPTSYNDKSFTFNVNTSDSHYTVLNAAQAGAYLVAADCNETVFANSKMDKEEYTVLINKSEKIDDVIANQTLLMAYNAVVYVVGKIDNNNINEGKEALYRFELGENGQWSAPQMLSPNVRNMKAQFTFLPDCDKVDPDVASYAEKSNMYSVVIQDAVNAAYVNRGVDTTASTATGTASEPAATTAGNANEPQPPVLLDLVLTYEFPKVGPNETGDGKEHEFLITSNIRGANYCANRRI